jgi:large subunit ribosomal protein L32e
VNVTKVARNPRKRKPKFIRAGGNHLKRLGHNWRKPKGIDSKMRRAIHGKPLRPKAGYGGNGRTRGIHPSGYAEVMVHNESELEGLAPGTQAVRIASKVGLLKRGKIVGKADELGLKVLNR